MTDLDALARQAFFASPVPGVITNDTGCVVTCNAAYEAMTGRSLDELVGNSTLEFVHADDLPGMISGLSLLVSGEPAVRHRRRHLTADGTWMQIEVITSLIANPEGGNDLVLVQTVRQDDAPTMLIDPVDPANELLTRQLYQPTGDAACVHGTDGTVVFASSSLSTLLGRPQGWMNGRRFTDDALDPRTTDEAVASHDDDPALIVLKTGSEATRTLGVTDVSGKRIWLSIVSGPVDREALPVRSGVRDITALIEAQRESARLAKVVETQLTYRADHDDLTGLAARHVVIGLVDDAIEAGRDVSVVFVDLDGFKAVNDTAGHVMGDAVLVEVARRLVAMADASVTVGRTGGDEFVAVTASPDAAEAFRDRVVAAAANPHGLSEQSPNPVGASVGVAHSRRDDSTTTLLARADAEMYETKRTRRPR